MVNRTRSRRRTFLRQSKVRLGKTSFHLVHREAEEESSKRRNLYRRLRKTRASLRYLRSRLRLSFKIPELHRYFESILACQNRSLSLHDRQNEVRDLLGLPRVLVGFRDRVCSGIIRQQQTHLRRIRTRRTLSHLLSVPTLRSLLKFLILRQEVIRYLRLSWAASKTRRRV